MGKEINMKTNILHRGVTSFKSLKTQQIKPKQNKQTNKNEWKGIVIIFNKINMDLYLKEFKQVKYFKWVQTSLVLVY